MWDLIVSVPDNCLSFNFGWVHCLYLPECRRIHIACLGCLFCPLGQHEFYRFLLREPHHYYGLLSFLRDLIDKRPESLLLAGSIVTLRISNIDYFFNMFPVSLAFSSVHPGSDLSVVGYIFGTVRGTLLLEEFVPLSLQRLHVCLSMVYGPWFLELTSGEYTFP